MAVNIGSVATITGNPQNMMIGTFLADSLPAVRRGAGAGGGGRAGADGGGDRADLPRRNFARRSDCGCRTTAVRVNRVLLVKSMAVSAGMIVFFFAGWPVPKVALVAGALLLVTRRVKPEKVYREIDWSLLVLFIGLFIVIAGLEKTTRCRRPVRRRRRASTWNGPRP